MERRNLTIVIHRRNSAHALAVTGLTLLAALAAFGQGSEPASKFELAGVYPSAHSTSPDTRDVSGGLMRGGRYHLRRATMLDLVRMAYGVDAKKVLGGPSWLETDRFDIRAIVPAGTTATTVKPMLRALLAERFGLVVHNDTKPAPAWALTASRHPLLKQSAGSGESRCRSAGSGEFIDVTCRNMAMAEFVSNMGRMDGAWYYLTDNLVVDQTGLEGAWDFDLKYSQRWNTTVAGSGIVSLFDAIDRLGLRLDPSMVPTPVVVVDSVNRTPAPNSPDSDKAFPPPPTEFEVADVKPTNPDYHGDDFQLEDGGRVTVRGTTLKSLIADAWGITSEMIVGAPKFMDSDRWDIVAKAPDVMAADGDTDIDSLRAMFRTLLADRFRLAVHYEDRPMPAYTMTASKPKLKQADPASRAGCREGPPTLVKVEPRSTNPVRGRLVTCTNVSMAYFAQQLPYLASAYVHSDVLDATGLEGGWDFTLSFSKIGQFRGNNVSVPGTGTAPEPSGGISAPEAMEKQLGLKMELRKRPVPVLVIDHIEEKPTDN
jgi:uncharacterized protein (TIGR03435 family)